MTEAVLKADRPTESELNLVLEKLVHWQRFATHLPDLTRRDIEEIKLNNPQNVERQKLDLFGTWLRRCSNASWKHVIIALERANENAPADVIRKHFTTASSLSIHSKPSRVQLKLDDEREICRALVVLHTHFFDLMSRVKMVLEEFICEGGLNIKMLIRFIQVYMHWEDIQLDQIEDLDHLFPKLHHYFDFLECELIVAITNKFIGGDLATRMKEYRVNALKLRCQQSVKNLKDELRKFYIPHLQDTSKMPEVCIKLNDVWKEADIERLYLLVKHLLPKTKQCSLLEHITIDAG